MKRTPQAFVQFFTYEQIPTQQAVLAAPQLVQSEAGLLGTLAQADRPPTPPELKVPQWGKDVANAFGNAANIPVYLQKYQAGQLALQKEQAELPAQQQAARTDYMKQVSINQAYIKEITKNRPDLLPYITNSSETGLGPVPVLSTPGGNAAGQNPLWNQAPTNPENSGDPRIPSVPSGPVNTTNPPTTSAPVNTTNPPTTPGQTSTDVPTNDPRLTSALIAARGGPLTAQAGSEGAISTDTGASPSLAPVKQSTDIPPPLPPSGDEVAKAYGSHIAPVSGWHREVNPDGSLGRFVMEHKDKNIQDQPLHDAWLPKLGVNPTQANPILAGAGQGLGAAALAAAQPLASTPDNNNAVQGENGISVLPAPPGNSPVPQVPGTADQMNQIPPAYQRPGDIQSGIMPVGAPKPPVTGPEASKAPVTASQPSPGQSPEPIPPISSDKEESDVWQKNYEGMNRANLGKLANDPKKITWSGNGITTVGGQHDPEGTIPGQGVNANKQYPVWKDSSNNLLYTKVADTGYDHWRYYLTPGMEPKHVEDQIGKAAMQKMQDKVIEMGQGDSTFPSLPRDQQISAYRAAVALDNSRKDRNPEYDAKVDAAEKVVDATTDMQMELDKLKDPEHGDPTGMFARNQIHKYANELSRTWGTSIPQDWADKIKDWTSKLPGGQIDPYHPSLDAATQKYNILLQAARAATQRLQGVSEKIPSGESQAQTDVASLGRLGDPDFDQELSTYAHTAKNDLSVLINHGVANNYNIPQSALLKANTALSPHATGADSQNAYRVINADNAKNKALFDSVPDGAWVVNSLGDRMRKGMPDTIIWGPGRSADHHP